MKAFLAILGAGLLSFTTAGHAEDARATNAPPDVSAPDVSAPAADSGADAAPAPSAPAGLPELAGDTNAPAPAPVTAPTAAPPPPPELPAPVQEVVRLAQTTLGEGVVLDYIATVSTPYRLTADQVVYLSDLGITSKVIQSLIQHSAAMDAAATAPPAQAPPPAPKLPTQLSLSPGGAPSPSAGGSVSVTNYPGEDLGGGAPAAPGVTYDAPPAAAPPAPPPQQPDPEAYQQFYPALSPYGSWVYLPETGWCWQPTVAVIHSDWQPYCDNGYWVWSDCGWYWNSSYTWGWAPFHYGRWFREPGRGWCWAPDRCWGPSWVSWRVGDGACGWAPLPPGCYWRPGFGLTYYGRHVAVGFDFGIGFSSYTYVGWSHFTDPYPWRHRLSRDEAAAAHGQTRVVNDIRGNNNTTVNVTGNNNTVIINNGPGVAPVQQHTRSEVPKVTLAAASAPHVAPAAGFRPTPGANILPVYRPIVTPSASPAFSPSSGIASGTGAARPAAVSPSPGFRPLPAAPAPSAAGPVVAASRPYLAPNAPNRISVAASPAPQPGLSLAPPARPAALAASPSQTPSLRLEPSSSQAVRPPTGAWNSQAVQENHPYGAPAAMSPAQPQGSVHYENYPGGPREPVSPGYSTARPSYSQAPPVYYRTPPVPSQVAPAAPQFRPAPPANAGPAGGGHPAPANYGGRNQGNRQGR